MRLILIAVLCIAACGDKKAPPPVENPAPPAPKNEQEVLIGKMSALADRMCGCADKPCAEVVNADVTALAKTIIEEHSGKATEAQVKRLTDISTK